MKICRFLLIIIIIVIMSLIMVWERNQITKIGYEVSRLQNRKNDLIEENRILRLKTGNLLAEERIAFLIKSLDLNLVYGGKVEDNTPMFSMANHRFLVREF